MNQYTADCIWTMREAGEFQDRRGDCYPICFESMHLSTLRGLKLNPPGTEKDDCFRLSASWYLDLINIESLSHWGKSRKGTWKRCLLYVKVYVGFIWSHFNRLLLYFFPKNIVYSLSFLPSTLYLTAPDVNLLTIVILDMQSTASSDVPKLIPSVPLTFDSFCIL